MYPQPFDYYRADTIDEALGLLEQHADKNATVLSGGHSLVPTMKSGLAAPDVVVDIGDIDEMSGVDFEDGTVRIGASTRYNTLLDDDTAHEHAPALAEATGEIGDEQVRSRGTVGGNVAHADPASDLPAVMIATDATVHARGPDGSRTIPIDDFFLGIYTTALTPDEILTQLSVPALSDGAGAYVKKKSPSSGYAMIGVAVRLETDGGTITNAGVAANGAKPHGIRLDSVEEAVVDTQPDEVSVEAVSERAMDGLDADELMDDIQASGEYRAQLLESYTKRALATAIDRL